MIVAVVRIEPEAKLRAVFEAERLRQLGDQKMALAELWSDGPAGFRIAIHGVLGAIILLFPIGGHLAEEDAGRGG